VLGNVLTAIVTPFAPDGSVDFDAFQALAAHLVDNGSDDDSLGYLRDEHPDVLVLALGANTGFAHAANSGIAAAGSELIALINTDIELEPDWLAVMCAPLGGDPGVAAVACKMLQLDDRRAIYDAGDVLRRDGACVQRGRFERRRRVVVSIVAHAVAAADRRSAELAAEFGAP